MGKWENTIVMFLSDNGASAEIMVRADGHDPEAPMGSAPTYLCLGPGWSTACNTPFRRHKTWTHEGGTSTPLIVSWPDGITARGESSDLAQTHPEKLQQLVKAWETSTEEFTELAKDDLSKQELEQAKGKSDRSDAMKKAQEEAKRWSQ
jgi:arylsulfatase A-like enzyme